jgi:hypothetical protein
VPTEAVLTPTPTFTEQPLAVNSVEIISVTSPIAVKNDATLTARAPTGSICSIIVTLPSGNISGTAALKEYKTVGSDGRVLWTWYITWNTKPGLATLKVSCEKDGEMFIASSQMEITN